MINTCKRVFVGLVLTAMLPAFTFAQSDNSTGTDSVKVAPNNWYQLDRQTTGYYGISLDKAYDFLKGKYGEENIVVYGRSLGGAFATRIAAANHNPHFEDFKIGVFQV